MNTPKHTPGPWKVEPGINHIKVWGERPKTGPSLIAEVRNEGTAHSTSGAREQANAVLIAAAPAMYDALRELTNAFALVVKMTPYGVSMDVSKVHDNARAALAQAEGRG